MSIEGFGDVFDDLVDRESYEQAIELLKRTIPALAGRTLRRDVEKFLKEQQVEGFV